MVQPFSQSCHQSLHHRKQKKNGKTNLHTILQLHFRCTTTTTRHHAVAQTSQCDWRATSRFQAKNLRKDADTVRPLSGIGGRKLLTSFVDTAPSLAVSRVHRCSCLNDSSYSSSNSNKLSNKFSISQITHINTLHIQCTVYNLSQDTKYWLVGWKGISRDSRKSRQKIVQITANFCENRKNHGKITAKTRHQITGPMTIIQSIKVNI